MRRFVPALVVALLAVSGHAVGGEARIHPTLGHALAGLDSARGPESYAALRAIWATWDRADPTQVEEALLSAGQDARLDHSARAYAGLLAAYARTRRGDLAGARKQVARLGFVQRWLTVGPFDNEGKAGLETEHGPEAELKQPIALGRAYTGKERPVRWRAVPEDAFPYGYVDVGSLMRPDRKICTFLTSFIRAKAATKTPRPLGIWVGAGGAFKLFWNGREVLKDTAYRGHDADRMATTVTLEPGFNQLTLKICGDEAAPVASVRLAGPRGDPDLELDTSNDPTASSEAAKLMAALGERKGIAAKPGLSGPVQSFERAVRDPAAPPRVLEAYARYLHLTGGDDAAEHRARDLARRAAEREPTIERLLLAGEVSEDRNTRAEWIGKAEALAKKAPSPSVSVLLARADHAGSGPNWRAASKFYDRVLELDPDNVQAVRGRVDLYNTAGLRRTALATLERALERNPQSVLLLNMQAGQLHALARTTEAAAVESRYAALRFDDRTFLSSRIDLALKRRDRPAAERWVERLIESDPDSLWALGVAARAYRTLAQPERAAATHRRALELAPEDVGTLRTLADLEGELGHREKQLELLQAILKIRPQEKDVREYLEHIEPAKPRPDEAWAMASAKFLKLRHAPAAGQNRRTLRDLTVTTVYENGLSSRFRQVVFQPLNDAGAALARQYGFQYQADREAVQLRGARVYRGDGRVDEAIEYGEGAADDPAISMYTSARNFYVQFPRLDPGDVVELRYRVDEVTPRNEFADYFGEVVHLQGSEPVQNAEYVLLTPKKRTFYIDQKIPGLKQTVTERGDQRIYRFTAERLAAVTPEPAMPPWSEVLGFIHVSTYKDWKQMGRWYWGLVKEQFDLDDETRKLARDVAKGAKTDLDKVKAVYGWVVKNTRYVALELGIYGYKPRRCVQTVTRGWGDCKDKATVIVTLLKELGIPSTIVILRTQLRGDFASQIPSLAPFDHAIVYVPSLNLYLDGTAEHTGSSELPEMDSGALALLVNEGDAKLVHLPERNAKSDLVGRNVVATLSANGDAKLDLEYETRGASAADWRRRYHAEATRQARITGDLGREFPGFEVAAGAGGIVANDLENLEQPVRLKIKGAARGFARKEGDALSLAVTPSTRLTPTFASLSQRTQDVRILSFSSLHDSFTLKLPAGSKVRTGPVNAQGSSPFGSYAVETSVQGGTVTVKSRLEVTATRVTPAEYAAFRKFCTEVDDAFSARLVVGP